MTNIVILTGAGISAESGISTFRDKNGLWETYKIDEVASPKAFRRDPELVHRFYNVRRAQLKSVNPNAAHVALAALEQALAGKGEFLLITQNVDDLYERSGSRRVLHMHGQLRKIRCSSCREIVDHHEDLGTDFVCAACGAIAAMRPDIVWFGENPYHMDENNAAIQKADIFVAIGTSGTVYPAAAFVEDAGLNGRDCAIIEINPNPTGNPAFTKVIESTAVKGVPHWVADFLARHAD